MKSATISDVTKTVEDWSRETDVPADVISQRISDGYRNRALIIPVETWATWPRTRPARPTTEWEWSVHERIWKTLPQFRFDVIVSLTRDIGIAELVNSKLTVLLNRGSYAAAIDRVHEFCGPHGKPMMSWMVRRADEVRCWGDPYERP